MTYVLETYKRDETVMVKGEGSYLYDADGNQYLDFVAGIAVNALGHQAPIITDTIKKQSEKLLHCSNLYWTQEQKHLAELLVEHSEMAYAFFCNSGAEAVEGALKTALKFGEKRNKIICFNQSFHGRTLGAINVTAQSKYQNNFNLLSEHIIVCEYNDYDDVINKWTDDVAAIIVEPIQGEGGIVPAKPSFLENLRAFCDDKNMLLIFDEIQCGAGRTGTYFAYEAFNVIPDVICMAKGLGGGVPIGAFLVNEKAAVLSYGEHGSTYGGNPLVCAVAAEVFKVIHHQGFLDEVKKKGDYMKTTIEKWQHPSIVEVRGMGLILGIEVNKDTKALVQAAKKKQLLVVGAGEKTIRVVPPLNVSQKEIDSFLHIFKSLL